MTNVAQSQKRIFRIKAVLFLGFSIVEIGKGLFPSFLWVQESPVLSVSVSAVITPLKLPKCTRLLFLSVWVYMWQWTITLASDFHFLMQWMCSHYQDLLLIFMFTLHYWSLMKESWHLIFLMVGICHTAIRCLWCSVCLISWTVCSLCGGGRNC